MSKRTIQGAWIWVALAATLCWATACSKTSEPTATPLLAGATQPPTAMETPSPPDPLVGQQLWQQKSCSGCHGVQAEGGIGPELAATTLSLDQVVRQLRSPRAVMPAFTESQVTDTEAAHIYAWLLSLVPPSPTAVTPTQAPPTWTPTAAAPTPAPTTATLPAGTAAPATATQAPQPTPTSTATSTSTPEPTSTPSLPSTPDPAVGQQVWQQLSCLSCHGGNAEGGIGPKLAGTGIGFDQVLLRVRSGKAPMPAFTVEQVSDLQLQHVFAWLRSLAPPTPTPVAAASYPTDALRAMWQHVNDMKVKCDFAKDLPERQAGDDAGRLNILKQYAGEAIQQGQAAVAQANQAIADIPNDRVRAVIRSVIDHVNAVIDQGNQALGQSSFGGAWPHAAEMVRISRLDAWPLATQAVRDAGLVGSVSIRVTDQAGNPIPGAFVTVLTAHTPVGVRANNAGQATIARVAAVPALQVKAYAAGRVYHEIHVNLAPGATAGGTIALPGPSVGGQTPSVANAIIDPSSGPGNATVIFRVNATDPQGALNLAEDQIFALNPVLGVAYVLRHTAGDQYELRVPLPNLSGTHTWSFFAVDHQCNTSNVLEVQYRAQ